MQRALRSPTCERYEQQVAAPTRSDGESVSHASCGARDLSPGDWNGHRLAGNHGLSNRLGLRVLRLHRIFSPVSRADGRPLPLHEGYCLLFIMSKRNEWARVAIAEGPGWSAIARSLRLLAKYHKSNVTDAARNKCTPRRAHGLSGNSGDSKQTEC